ncbi:MAG: DUF2179 domain-containing protein [Anaerolineae bacterium]|nr:DUF2179 domain-containing protein [Anaerolineae bacterium]
MAFDVILAAVGIFVLRVFGNMITTIRLIVIVRGQKLSATILGFLEALIFAVALGSVVTNLDNIVNLMAYSSGYAVGGYLGMVIENRLIQRFISVQALSMRYAHDIAVAIRKAGYGATESWGEGAEGHHGVVTAVVGHHQVSEIIQVVESVDPKAFVTMSELRGTAHGHFRRLLRPER